MRFKGWLLIKESIVVQDTPVNATIKVVEPHYIREFNYQTENSWSSFFIAPYHAERIGYLSISYRPTHIGIIKTTPIESGKGADISFIKSLTPMLNTQLGKPIPYKEGESDWMGMLKHVDKDVANSLQQNFKDAEEKDLRDPSTPDIKQGASNQTKVTTGMSVSKASGSWAYFVKNEHPNFAIPRIVEIMERAIKPLMDNDIVDFYEVVERSTGKRLKIVYSKKGEQEQDNWKNEYNRSIAYIKFLAETMLKNYPTAKQIVLDSINGVGVRVSGGGKHPAADIQPANTKIPLDNLLKFVKDSYASEETLLFFLKALKKDSHYHYALMNKIKQKEHANALLFYAEELLDDKVQDYIDNAKELYLSDPIAMFKHEKELLELLPQQYNKFKHDYEQAVNASLENISEPLSRSEIHNIKTLANHININPAILAQIDQLHAGYTKADADEKAKREQERENNKFIINEGSWKYLVLNDGVKAWEDIPDKYISWRGESMDEEEFISNEIVDFDEVHEDAYEKAMEKALDNVEEKPSESYGQDKNEVLSDIEYDADDFASYAELDVPENTPTDDLVKIVKDQYYDDYVSWKIEKLKEEEDEESWKYEPEADNNDIYAAAAELSVDVAYDEKGLIVLSTDERNNVFVEYNSKFEAAMLPILKRAVQSSLKAKDPEFNEPVMKVHAKIELAPRDKTKGKVYNAYQFSRN